MTNSTEANPKKGYKRHSSSVRILALNMVRAGTVYEDISKKLGVAQSTISSWVSRDREKRRECVRRHRAKMAAAFKDNALRPSSQAMIVPIKARLDACQAILSLKALTPYQMVEAIKAIIL